MRIPDIFRLNDWQMRKFSLLVLSIIVAYDSSFLTDKFLFEIPMLPQLLGFIVLTFIPGFIILRILKVHNIDRTANLLLVVGLSLSFIMLLGLIVCIFSPFVNLSKPISDISLFLSFNISILILLIICYFNDKDFKSTKEFLDINPPSLILLLSLFPFLSIFGAYSMNHYNNNIILIVLLTLISICPTLIAFKLFPKKLYPFIIFIVSISILYHVNLISDYIRGWDINVEYYAASLVVKKSFWNPSNVDSPSLLLFAILAPTYALLCKLGLIWTLKLVFPFIFSLTPVALYRVCEGQFKDRIVSAISPFIFMFYYGFFKNMPDKQYIAEFFLILVVMSLFNENIPNSKKGLISSLLSFSLVVSHYGVSYVFMITLIFVFIFSRIWKMSKRRVPTTFYFIYPVTAISWYMFVSGGRHFEDISSVGYHILINIRELIFNPEYRSGYQYASIKTPTVLWAIYKYINMLIILFVIIGILKLLISMIRKKNICKNDEFSLLSLAFFVFFASGINIGYHMGMDRVYQITSVILSPFAVVGGCNIFEVINRIFKVNINISKILSIFIVIYFLFSSGLIFEITHDPYPFSFALNESIHYDYPVFEKKEVRGAAWLGKYGVYGNIAAQGRERLLFLGFFPDKRFSNSPNSKTYIFLNPNATALPPYTYVYLGSLTIEKNEIRGKPLFGWRYKHVELDKTVFYQKILMKINKIYCNDGSNIYLRI